MKKDRLAEIDITEAAFPNIGVGVCEGKRVRVKGALLGQKVLARFAKGRDKAELVRVIERSEDEKPPDCFHFGVCGGCSFRSVPYETEAAHKERVTLDLFAKAGIAGFEYAGFIPAQSPDRYRNKMEFAFGDDGLGGALTLGLRKRGSYYEALNADGCPICHEDFGAVVKATREFFAARDVAFYHRARKTGLLRHLVIRRAHVSGEILLNLVTAQADNDFEKLLGDWISAICALKLDGRIASIWHTSTDAVADVIKPEGARLVYGEPYINEKILDLTFRVGPFSFFQTNAPGASILYKTAIGFLPDMTGKTVYDLYCGAGTITQICAKDKNAARVIGVEINAEAVQAAIETAEANNINAEFICGDVLKTPLEAQTDLGAVIIDPPRDGVHPKALKKIADLNAPFIVYISCNPVTLIRDLSLLHTYRLDKLAVVDMFPRAAHVECAALLRRRVDVGF